MIKNHNTVIPDTDRLGITNVNEKTKRIRGFHVYFRIASILPEVTQSSSSAELGLSSGFLPTRFATHIQLSWLRSGLLDSSPARTFATRA